jgi:ATP adenylyltransferase
MIIEELTTSKNLYFSKNIYYDIPLFETQYFKVVPSLGSLIEGWVMIVPKNFYISFGAIDNTLIYEELFNLIKDLRQIIKSEYGELVMFEHGPVSKKSLVGCSIDYAHLHVVPISIDLIEKSKAFSNQNIEWLSVEGIEKTVEYYNNRDPYLFVTDINENSFIGTGKNLPSQLFRKTIANYLGIADLFDWKVYPFTDNINKTIKVLSKHKKIFSNQAICENE